MAIPSPPPTNAAIPSADPSTGGGPTPRLFTPAFIRLLIGQAGFGYAFSSFFLVPKFVTAELDAGPALVGALNAVHGGAAVVSLFVIGVLVDRHGRRPFLTAGAALMAVCSLGFLAVDSIGPLIFALRVGQGVAFAMAFVAGAALTVDQAPEARLGQAIGYFGTTMLSMNAIAPLGVEAIAARHGWSLAFATAAVGAVSCAIASLTLPARPMRRAEPGSTARLIDVARRPEQMRAAVVIALVGSCFASLFVFGQLQALAVGLPDVHTLFAAYAIAAVIARVGLGHLGDRIGRMRVSIVMLIVYAIAAVAVIWLAQVGLVAVGLTFGLAHGLFYPTYNASVVEGAPQHERGRIVALFQGWFNAGMATGSLAFGWIAEVVGLSAVFGVAAGGIVVALAVLIRGTTHACGAAQAISTAAPGHTP